MRRSFALLLILSACGPLPAHDEGASRGAVRGGDDGAASAVPRPSERVATGVIGGSVTGPVLGEGPLQGGNIGTVN